MYSGFYNFSKEPFHITPDPEFLFLSPSHKQALGSIIYGVNNKKGFIAITGAIGVGKTTILRTYLEGVDKNYIRIIYIFNSNISFQELLKTISQELGLPIQTEGVLEMLNRLHEAIITEYKQRRSVVIIIDEAQNMPVETLENLRMLSNLETSSEKLIQIVLIGQPEFAQLLNLDQLRQLNQRISIRSTIVPLNDEECHAYIKHRLAKVALDDSPIFTKGALKKIVREAKGILRTINILCDNALITGFGYQKKPVDIKMVREAIADFKSNNKHFSLRWALAPGAVLFLIVFFFILYFNRGVFSSKLENTVLSQTPEPTQILTAVRIPSENPISVPSFQTEKSNQEDEVSKQEETTKITSSDVIKTVKKGDTLFRLTLSAYGFADDRLLERVKRSNPGIKDIARILVGQKILFPEADDKD